MDFKNYPHRRYNPLAGRWVTVSPHRTQRPWQGQRESVVEKKRSAYDPDCYLCPGNVRAGGKVNPPYTSIHVFDNDFAALLPMAPNKSQGDGIIFKAESIRGICRVICFSPRHDLTLAGMQVSEIRAVVDAWAEQSEILGRTYRWIQVFENKGEMMGCSNPHPHCQIWAADCLPDEPFREDENQQGHVRDTGDNLLSTYLEAERESGQRMVTENDHWSVVVPFWAVWPFETLLLPKRHVLRLPDLTQEERDALADILKCHLMGYDRLFGVSFPYTMGWHGAPFQEGESDHWQLHAHFYPPLLRSATIRKFMVGYELLAEAQRDITPEKAALMLREQSDHPHE
jgi:UDPglucose--hexose-1-phosphate uridylyltransferase